MTSKSFYRASFLLPIVIPLVAQMLVSIPPFGSRSPLDDSMAFKSAGFLYHSLVLSAIPYVLFLIAVLVWSRRRDAAQIRRLTFVAPLIFLPVFGLYWILYQAVTMKAFVLDDAVGGAGFLGLFVLGFGYAYVGLVNGAHFSLRKLGKVQADNRATIELGSTVIYVDDVEPVLDFYRSAFGCETRFLDPDVQLEGRVAGAKYQFAEVATAGGTLQFATPALGALLMPGFERAPNGQPAGVEIAFYTADVQAAFERAVAAGATPVRFPSQMPWGQTVAYVRSLEATFVGLCSPLGDELQAKGREAARFGSAAA